ncbi:MAG: hypothetical protein R3E56_11060 [Burkholderiaceae bacterium]
MSTRIRIQTLLAGAAMAALALQSTAHAQTTLTLSSWVPPTSHVVTDIIQPWMADVEKATEGRVKISLLPKPVGSPPQHWELARKGVADVTFGNFTYEPERFKHVWFAELPMMGSSAEASSVALWRTYEKFLAGNDTFKGVTLMGVGMLGGGQFHHPSKVIDSPDDLKGQKVRMEARSRNACWRHWAPSRCRPRQPRPTNCSKAASSTRHCTRWNRWSASAWMASSENTPSFRAVCTTRPSSSR